MVHWTLQCGKFYKSFGIKSLKNKLTFYAPILQVFTAAPPLAMGLFDKVCSAETHLAHPGLYATKNNGESSFNIKVSASLYEQQRIRIGTRRHRIFKRKKKAIRSRWNINPTLTNAFMFKQVFWVWIVNALIHSSLLYWLPLLALTQDVVWANGRDGGYLLLGNFVYTVSIMRYYHII